MGRWVLLVHELSDAEGGAWHYDWMIQPQGGPQTPLISFRVSARPDDPATRVFEAERIGNHRAAYLEYEGEVSDGRGRVRRVGGGFAEVDRDDGEFIVRLDGTRTWIGVRRDAEGPRYHFRLSGDPAIGHTGH